MTLDADDPRAARDDLRQAAIDAARAGEPTPMLSTVEGIRALVVPVSGEVREVVLTDRAGAHLAEFRRLTGSDMIEHVRGPLGVSLWVDEEGALDLVSRGCRPRPSNPRIDLLLLRSDGWSIRGDVVITGEVGADGDATSLPWTTATFLRQVFADEDHARVGED